MTDASAAEGVDVTLDAVIVAVTADTPRLLTVEGPDGLPALPSGLLHGGDRTLETGLRRWVADQTGLTVGYVEQLYTFGDRSRSSHRADGEGVGEPGRRQLSIAYLALVREQEPTGRASWTNIYDLLPWEDHRGVRPTVLDDALLPALARFAGGRPEREERLRIVFGPPPGGVYDGVRVLERYELLYEAGLLHEAGLDDVGTMDSLGEVDGGPGSGRWRDPSQPMHLDHRRMAATAVGRLRGKLTYRPVVFELLPETFTLLQLQRTVEALAGVGLHKQNFRRLVEGGGLVEGTGRHARTGGRPAELFRFRREVLGERPAPGFGTPWVRGS